MNMKQSLVLLLFVLCGCLYSEQTTVSRKALYLNQMLGYKPTDKLLIINADDAGMSHGSNQAIIKSMDKGLVQSSTIMVPCPWFSEIKAYALKHPDVDFGVHLTHTSEWKRYRWAPLTSAQKTPGLRDKDGYMHHEVPELYKSSNAVEAYIEAKAQIEKALKSGINISHIDSHMGAMMYSMMYAINYIRLAKEFNLPLRMPSLETLKQHKAEKLLTMLDNFRIVYPDYLIYGVKARNGMTLKETWLKVLKNLKPGVTEIYIHPALPNQETKAITNSWRTRAEELELFTTNPEIRKAITDGGIKLIGYRTLKKLQDNYPAVTRLHSSQ